MTIRILKMSKNVTKHMKNNPNFHSYDCSNGNLRLFERACIGRTILDWTFNAFCLNSQITWISTYPIRTGFAAVRKNPQSLTSDNPFWPPNTSVLGLGAVEPQSRWCSCKRNKFDFPYLLILVGWLSSNNVSFN